MAKRALIVVGFVLLFLVIYWYASKPQNKIAGSWQLQTLEINGTVLQGKTLGDWKWEFDNEGDYSSNVAGSIEKGTYSIVGNKLTLKSITVKKRPEQILVIEQLDSVQMHLVSDDGKNKSSLHFLKLKKD